MALSETTIETVKATVPVLRDHGTTIIQKFYDILFERYPQVKQYFNMDRQRGGSSSNEGIPSQVASLARAVMAYAQHIDNVGAIMTVVESICHKHVSRGVEAPHYDAVGECLIAAMGEVLGDAATPGIVAAWTEAYGFLATAFIDKEKQIRADLAAKAGYDGSAEMTIEKVAPGDEDTLELVLKRADGEVAGAYADGQYVSVGVVDEAGEKAMTTVKLIAGEEGKLTVRVDDSQEQATIALRKLEVGASVPVSMPCGRAN